MLKCRHEGTQPRTGNEGKNNAKRQNETRGKRQNIKRKKKKFKCGLFRAEPKRDEPGIYIVGDQIWRGKNRPKPREKKDADEDSNWGREGLLFCVPLFITLTSIYLSQWSSQQHLRALTFWLRGSDSGVMPGQSHRLGGRG